MRQYRQLTEDDRIEIYAMKQAGNTQTFIARRLGVHSSTVSRELARNTGLRGYRPKQAHWLSVQRCQHARKAIKMTPQTIRYIENKIRQEHSPEQIAGRMKLDPDYDRIDAAFTPSLPTMAESLATMKPLPENFGQKSISPTLIKPGNAA